MAKTDRSILAANDQSKGQFGDPDKLESSISHLADTIDKNDTDVSVLKTDNTSNKGRLNTLEGDVSTLKTDNTSNKSRITENENDIAYTDARVTDLLRDNPQPSEVVDARLGFPVLRNKLENIDEKLAEKVQYFENVSSMVSANNLKPNTVCKTLGFYTSGDGGSALYKVVNGSYTADGSFIIALSNSLFAKLMYEGTEVKAEQLGFKKDASFDCGAFFRNLMAFNTPDCVVEFGVGSYYFSPTLIQTNNSMKIRGVENAFSHTKGTIFQPFQANQRYILKLGGNSDFSNPANHSEKQLLNYMIDWIWFNDANFPLSKTGHGESYGMLCVEFSACVYLNVGFTGVSRPVFFRSSWEIQFDNLYFRGCYNTDGLFYIGSVLPDSYSNISALVIKNLDIETYRSTVFVGVNDANVNDISILHCNIETDVVDNANVTIIPYTDGNAYLTYAKYPLFLDNVPARAFKIGNLNLQMIMRGYYQKNGVNTVSYLFKGCPSGTNIFVDNIYSSGELGGFFGLAYGDFESYGKLVVPNMIFDHYNQSASGGLGTLKPTYYTHAVTSGLVDVQKTNGVLLGKQSLKYGHYEGLNLSTVIQVAAGRTVFKNGIINVDGSETCRTYDFDVLSNVKIIIKTKTEWIRTFRVYKTLAGTTTYTDVNVDSSFANKVAETTLTVNKAEADSFYINFRGTAMDVYSMDVVPA